MAYTVLRHEAAIDAIFCRSDQIARAYPTPCAKRGAGYLTIALVGYDIRKVLDQTGRPPLTTVDMRPKNLGKHGARRLIEAIGGQPSHGLQQLPCQLVIRKSTGNPPHLTATG